MQQAGEAEDRAAEAARRRAQDDVEGRDLAERLAKMESALEEERKRSQDEQAALAADLWRQRRQSEEQAARIRQLEETAATAEAEAQGEADLVEALQGAVASFLRSEEDSEEEVATFGAEPDGCCAAVPEQETVQDRHPGAAVLFMTEEEVAREAGTAAASWSPESWAWYKSERSMFLREKNLLDRWCKLVCRYVRRLPNASDAPAL